MNQLSPGSEGDPVVLDTSAYSMLNFNVSSMPVVLRFGVCLPEQCKQAMLDDFGQKISI